jgi:hypothetical protein
VISDQREVLVAAYLREMRLSEIKKDVLSRVQHHKEVKLSELIRDCVSKGIPSDMVREALWELLDERAIVLTSDQTLTEVPVEQQAASLY